MDIGLHMKSDEIQQRLSELSVHNNGKSSAAEKGSWRKSAEEAPTTSREVSGRSVASTESESVGNGNLSCIVPEKVEGEGVEPSYRHCVNVPSSLVGMLLSNRKLTGNFITNVGKATFTFISLPKHIDKSSAEEGVVSEKHSRNDIVVFTVAGKNSANVALASSFLLRVVNGEILRDVLKSVRTCEPQPTSSRDKKLTEAIKGGEPEDVATKRNMKSTESVGANSDFKNTKSDKKNVSEKSKVSKKKKKATDLTEASAAYSQQDRRNAAVATASPIDVDQDLDENDINAQLFAAPPQAPRNGDREKGKSGRGRKSVKGLSAGKTKKGAKPDDGS